METNKRRKAANKNKNKNAGMQFSAMEKNKRKTDKNVGMKKVLGTDHLLEEILFRLSPTMVRRLRPVSKYWNKLISDLSFRRRHSKRVFSQYRIIHQSTNAGFITMSENGSLSALDASSPNLSLSFVRHSFKDTTAYFIVVDSSHGLLLLALQKDKTYLEYFVCNPLTEDFLQLPSCPSLGLAPQYENALISLKLVFDDSDSIYYKVVMVTGCREKETQGYKYYSVAIYSSKSGSWESTKPLGACGQFSASVSFNGALYCPPKQNEDRMFIFDLASPIRPKSLLISIPSWIYFGESSESLYLVEKVAGGKYLVWEKKNARVDNCPWVRKFQFQHKATIKILHVYSKGMEEEYLQIFFTNGTAIYALDNSNYTGTSQREDYIDDTSFRVETPDKLKNLWSVGAVVFTYTPRLFPLA